ncbi:MAG TPA: ribosome-associated protein, partial [Cobetia sp.]|nr:ribosome-associated protein [Cobetia sp.]
MQYVGKLMRKEDLDAVRAVFEAMEQQNVRRDASFQRLERWRDRLLDDDEAFVIFVEDYPHVDRQALRQLIRNARAERDAGKQPNSAKKLFKLLRAELDL